MKSETSVRQKVNMLRLAVREMSSKADKLLEDPDFVVDYQLERALAFALADLGEIVLLLEEQADGDETYTDDGEGCTTPLQH
jgi:hypothetical protein